LRAVGRDDSDVCADFGKERIERDPGGEKRLPILARKKEKTATLAPSTVLFQFEEFVEDLALPQTKFD
jgi:hypothetical protein